MSIKNISFEKRLAQDEQIMAFNRKIKKGVYSIDSESILAELMNMHGIRKLRKVTKKEIISQVQSQLLDNNLQTSAYRSRIAEIKVETFIKYNELETDIEDIKKYLIFSYASDLSTIYKNVADRKSAVDFVVSNGYKILKKLNQIIVVCDLLISDLDSAGFTLQRIQKVFELSMQRDKY